MEFRELMQSDIEYVAQHSVSRGMFGKQPARIEHSYALLDGGDVLGVGGIRIIVPGTAWAWVDLTTAGLAHTKTCYRVIRDWMAKLAELHNIRRLQAYVDLEFPEAIHLVKHLGFERESIMWDFLDGKPAAMYVRIYHKESE